MIHNVLKKFFIGTALFLGSCDSKDTPTPIPPAKATMSITDFYPTTVKVGDTVFINGKEFGTSIAATKVSIGEGLEITPIALTNVKVTFIVPEGTVLGNAWVKTKRSDGVTTNSTAQSPTQITIEKKPEKPVDPEWKYNRYYMVANAAQIILDANLDKVLNFKVGSDGNQVTLRAGNDNITTALINAEMSTALVVTGDKYTKAIRFSNINSGTSDVVNKADTINMAYFLITATDATKKKTDIYYAFMRSDGTSSAAGAITLQTAGENAAWPDKIDAAYVNQKTRMSSATKTLIKIDGIEH